MKALSPKEKRTNRPHYLIMFETSPYQNFVFDYDGTIATIPIDWLAARTLFREDVSKSLGLEPTAIKGERLDEMEEELLKQFPERKGDIFRIRQVLESDVQGTHVHLEKTVKLIKSLASKNPVVRLFVVSNNLKETVLAGLDHLNLTDLFTGIYGVDEVGAPKPSILAAGMLSRDHGVQVEETVFFGDSDSTDGEFCRRVGYHFVHVDELS